MKASLISELEGIVGAEHVTREPERLSAYFRDPGPSIPLVAVFPKEGEEVRSLVRLADRETIPLFTLKDRCFPGPLPASGGIVMDFRRMDLIEEIDTRNLTAHIWRGVTWEQLGRELARHGVKSLLPAAATSPYVLDSMVSRVIMRSAARFPEVQVSNLRMVLADGRIHRTGSHALDEKGSDSKEDGGPNLSRWYIGAEDIYGLPMRASIWLYPQPAEEAFLFFGFEDLAQAVTAIRNIPRKEVCAQALVMNSRFFQQISPSNTDPDCPWILLLGCEGNAVHVEFQSNVCRKDALALGGREMPELKDSLGEVLQRPWFRTDPSHGFYTFHSRVSEFHDLVSTRSRLPLAELFVSHGYGRAAWCQFQVPEPCPEGGWKAFDEIQRLLVERGAYFDRPLGAVADRFYEGNPAYFEQLRRVKNMMDPKRILNPDQLVRGV